MLVEMKLDEFSKATRVVIMNSFSIAERLHYWTTETETKSEHTVQYIEGFVLFNMRNYLLSRIASSTCDDAVFVDESATLC